MTTGRNRPRPDRPRRRAQSRVLPPLLVEAERIAATVILGDHGRKRAGPGESFWQYRPYSFGDSTQRIDWHKSARSDRVYIRENEWEAANTLWLWASPSRLDGFQIASLQDHQARPRPAHGAGAMASWPFARMSASAPSARPMRRIIRAASWCKIADWLLQAKATPLPAFTRMPRFSSALLVGDFFDTPEDIATAVTPLAAAGISGHLVQMVDPAEETLPYAGRVEFQEMAGPLKFLSAKTETLREAYSEKLAAQREAPARALQPASAGPSPSTAPMKPPAGSC